jgi:hypothetical protein
MEVSYNRYGFGVKYREKGGVIGTFGYKIGNNLKSRKVEGSKGRKSKSEEIVRQCCSEEN